MYSRTTLLLLRWLRVPPQPQPPHGDPASLRVFRAGRNFLNLRLLKWGLAQVLALAGIIFWFGVFSDLGPHVEERRLQNQAQTAGTPPAAGHHAVERAVNTMVHEITTQAEATGEQFRQLRENPGHYGPLAGFYAWRNGMVHFLSTLPKPAMLVIWFFEIGGLLLYVVQLPLTFLLARLDYEMRWYMVTDRSLRIRSGVTSIQEMTMSFANIQQVVVSQGPLQRLLGLADVRVQSAGGGGGGGAHQSGHHHDSMHLGVFHGVENATEIRDLILTRLRQFREAGLGDPDDQRRAEAPAAAPSSTASEPILAARELLEETRALRRALT